MRWIVKYGGSGPWHDEQWAGMCTPYFERGDAVSCSLAATFKLPGIDPTFPPKPTQ